MFQLHEVMGTNVLANEVVRHFSNLTAKGCSESEKRMLRAKHALGGGITDFHSSEHIQCAETLLKLFYLIIRVILICSCKDGN